MPADKTLIKPRLPRGLADRDARRDPRHRGDGGEHPRGLRALWLRAGRDAADRVHRGARQVPARPGPPQRGRLLVPGRRPARGGERWRRDREAGRVAVAPLRPHRAARPLRRGELQGVAEAVSAATAAGWVFRNEKPGPGRFRQFMQFDADTVGAASPAADAEMCMMMADTLEALGIGRGQYVIKVNNRKLLDGVMEAVGLGGDGERRPPPDGAARHRQARPARHRRRPPAARRRPQGRQRRLHQGRGPRRRRRSRRWPPSSRPPSHPPSPAATAPTPIAPTGASSRR